MNKIFASIACIMAVAMLSACGSQEEPDSAPAWPDYSGYNTIEVEPNDTKERATPIEAANLISGYNFKGTLENRKENNSDGKLTYVIDEDFYKIDLKYQDSISITASNATNISSPFRVKFSGPCPRPASICVNKTFDVLNQTNSLSVKINAGDFNESDSFGTKAAFYIEVSSIIDDSQPSFYIKTPYAITIKLLDQSR